MDELREMLANTICEIGEHADKLKFLEDEKWAIELDIRVQQEYIEQKRQLQRQLTNQLEGNAAGPFEMDRFDLSRRQQTIYNLRSAEPLPTRNRIYDQPIR